MISPNDIYHVLAATVPLYVAMIFGYISVKWWNLFTPDQCAGINTFVAKFSVPLLSFQVIAASNPYKMNQKLIYADCLQKLLAFILLQVFAKFRSSSGSFDWLITGFSLSTLPNSLILGIPLLTAMYGNEATILLSQIVVLQSLLWYNLLLFLFEFRAAKAISVTPPVEDTGELEDPQREQSNEEKEEKSRTSTKIKTKFILLTVGKKLMSNPNTHATAVALIWSIIRFRWGLEFPLIVEKSISILADGGLGMAMFSLGLFMASQASIIACGTWLTSLAMGMKFLVGPALMAVSSLSLRLRHTVFKVSIVQAALPQGLVPFVFAKEYNVHPDILSTGVLLGLLIALPTTLAYYFLLGL